jgi:NAD(P)H-binding
MATVKRALTGIDAVIQSLGVSAGPEIIFEPTRLFSNATQVLVSAMEEAGIKRSICVTGLGAGDSRGSGGFLYSVALHLLLGRIYDDKDVQERIVRRSKLNWDLTGRRGGFPHQADRQRPPFCIRRRCSRASLEMKQVSRRGVTMRTP